MEFINKKSLGIIGGMGSQASSWLLQRIIHLSKAPTDQDNLEIVLHNNSSIPDRTLAIINDGKSPLQELQRSVNILNNCKVDVALLACMTAHLYHDELNKLFHGHLLNVAQLVFDEIINNPAYCKGKRIGLIGSTGMITTGMFQKKLEPHGFEVIVLNSDEQQKYFMDPLYGDNGIKAGVTEGKVKQLFLSQLDILTERGADIIIGACSEVPLIVNENIAYPFIDSFDLLARKTVDYCYNTINL
ncbi:aspartate/glutamate racemase family protein [Mucilaginibacter sp. RCC_168]|uniref:aspartate/glutamate racemase family protein n=1 Tax=Mucilaginibacter sp. RCC_168 TaxID=3239221 RepID=UPI00352577A8